MSISAPNPTERNATEPEFAVSPLGSPEDVCIHLSTSELLLVASSAFADGRLKQCVAVTNAVLKIDPANKGALAIQSQIATSSVHRIERIRAMLQDRRSKPLSASGIREARLAIQTVLDANPEDDAALSLLFELDSLPPSHSEALNADRTPIQNAKSEFGGEHPGRAKTRKDRKARRAVGLVLFAAAITGAIWQYYPVIYSRLGEMMGGATNTPASPPPTLSSNLNAVGEAMGELQISVDDGVQVFLNDRYVGDAPMPTLKFEPGIYHVRYKLNGVDLAEEDISIVSGTTAKNSLNRVLGRLELFVVPNSAEMQIDDGDRAAIPMYLDVKPGSHRVTFSAEGYESQVIEIAVQPGERRNVSAVLRSGLLSSAPASGLRGINASRELANPTDNPTPAASGTLAINALLPVDVYINNRSLGTTPLSLKLAPGSYNVEYRHGDHRKTITSLVKSNEVTRATISFDVTVQIDSTPESDVYVADGLLRRLGRTPLNNVQLPIGSTLVFRSSGFPDKRRIVSAEDAVIRNQFP